MEEKELIIKENEIIKNKIQNIIFNIQMANQKLEDIAMDRRYMKTLDEYIDNTYLKLEIDEKYQQVKLELSELDANLKTTVENATKKTIYTNSKSLSFLEKYSEAKLSLFIFRSP